MHWTVRVMVPFPQLALHCPKADGDQKKVTGGVAQRSPV